jgi:hypothetical protein
MEDDIMDSVEPYDLNGLKDFRYELFSKKPRKPA